MIFRLLLAMERLRKHKKFISRLLATRKNTKLRNKLIKKANRGEICTICEIVKNVIHNPFIHRRKQQSGKGVLLSKSKRTQLKKHSKALRKLLNKKINIQKKKNILLSKQSGKGFILPLILSLAGPIVERIIRSFT